MLQAANTERRYQNLRVRGRGPRRRATEGGTARGRWGVIMQKGKAHKFAIFLELLSNANDV